MLVSLAMVSLLVLHVLISMNALMEPLHAQIIPPAKTTMAVMNVTVKTVGRNQQMATMSAKILMNALELTSSPMIAMSLQAVLIMPDPLLVPAMLDSPMSMVTVLSATKLTNVLTEPILVTISPLVPMSTSLAKTVNALPKVSRVPVLMDLPVMVLLALILTNVPMEPLFAQTTPPALTMMEVTNVTVTMVTRNQQMATMSARILTNVLLTPSKPYVVMPMLSVPITMAHMTALV